MSCESCNIKEKTNEFIKEFESVKNPVIEILHKVQDYFGYIPQDSKYEICYRLNISQSELSSIISFYNRFSETPVGKYDIQVCMGTACFVKGSDKLLKKVESILGIKDGEITDDKKFSIKQVRCIGACAIAPAIVINHDVYGNLNEEKLEKIIRELEQD